MKILIVDDDLTLLEVFKSQLEDLGHQVTKTTNGAEALELIHRPRHGFDLVISDNDMPVMSGSELVLYLDREKIPHPPLIMWSGHTAKVSEFVKSKVFELLPKPLDGKTLEKHLDRIAYMKYSKILVKKES